MRKELGLHIAGDSLILPKRSIPLSAIQEAVVDFRVVTMVIVIMFMLISGGIVFTMFPSFTILAAGVFFVWLRVEYSRYIVLKIRNPEGKIEVLLSTSMANRNYIYAVVNTVNRRIDERKKQKTTAALEP